MTELKYDYTVSFQKNVSGDEFTKNQERLQKSTMQMNASFGLAFSTTHHSHETCMPNTQHTKEGVSRAVYREPFVTFFAFGVRLIGRIASL